MEGRFFIRLRCIFNQQYKYLQNKGADFDSIWLNRRGFPKLRTDQIFASVGQTFNQGHVNFAFKNPSASSMTQIPGIGGNFVRSDSSQNYLNMQNSGNPFGINQQGLCGQNHFGQPMQQDHHQYNYTNHQTPCPQSVQSAPLTPCLCAPGMGQQQMIPCANFLPQNIVDQIRSCVGNTTPIFIMPQAPQAPQVQQNLPPPQIPAGLMGYAPNYPAPPAPPQQFHDHYNAQNRSPPCNCCRWTNSPNPQNPTEGGEIHRCSPGTDDTVCTRANCPASINLQALASQLLSIQGVIPCAATRLVLRKVPGSNVTSGVDETMERAQKAISSLTKEQLMNEARNALQVTGMINLHMVSNPPQNIVPVLTTVQLKVNALKAAVEGLLNRGIGECQSVGMAGAATLDPTILGIKSDAELREVLNTLRQRECEERVNLNYAPYHSQRVVAESRLANFQSKISQVEAEMERRRSAAMPWADSGQFGQGFSPPQAKDPGRTCFDSPNPFLVQVRSPRRLNLKPNVGGPETTYEEAFTVSKLDKEQKTVSGDPPKEDVEVKKKLRIHIDEKGELSVKKQSLEGLGVGELVQLSPEVVIVIDKAKEKEKEKEEPKQKEKRVKILKKNKKQKHKKSEESIPSDYSTYSESSVASEGEEEERRSRNEKEKPPGRKNPFSMKKKTPKTETEDRDGGEIIDEALVKKEEREDVVMLSELLRGRLPFHDDKDARGSDSVSLLEAGLESVDLRHRCSAYEEVGLDVITEHHVDDRLDTIYSPKFITGSDCETVSVMREGTGSSDPPEKGKNVDEKSCVLKEAQNQTSSDDGRSHDRADAAGGSARRKSCAHDKENFTPDDGSAVRSTAGRRKKEDCKNLGGSYNSMDKEQRKRFRYRFK